MRNKMTGETELWFGYSMKDALARMAKRGVVKNENDYDFIRQDYED